MEGKEPGQGQLGDLWTSSAEKHQGFPYEGKGANCICDYCRGPERDLSPRE